ncbi:MAG: energy-coupling factor ABC transporter permease [Chloroflexi bacterium]|nr:energy-coupling factor ABC transporter permease [Chloroflexota bacterium]
MLYSPAPLHIPENFLSLAVSAACWVVTILTLSLAISKTNKSLGERQIPLMGIMAAFIFAAQMINFPVAGGTSGHLLGGVLAAVILGPWAGMLVMTAVIALQALLFQDGGLSVMGANILNMGLVTAAIGYGLYRLVSNRSRKVKLAAIGFAAWLSVLAGALFTSLQIWLSGNADLKIIVPVMLFIHALIGVGDALITVAAISFIMRTRPDLLGEESESAKGGQGWVWVGVAVTLLVVLLSPFASADPDGLERVATDLGFIGQAQLSPFQIIPDYTVPFLGQTALSTVIAGVIGAIVVGLVAYLIGRGVKAKSQAAGSK